MGLASAAVSRLRRHTELPIAVGFGISGAGQAGDIAGIADAAVVGSALVRIIGEGGPDIPDHVETLAHALAEGVRGARA